ncbi:MAG: serine hydrolase [Bryobacterales bacterium]|nr:serine hydrolase [Bryobacterales bacterium]
MRRFVLFTLLTAALASGATARFPGRSWEKKRPAGWSESGLKAARDYAATLKTAAVVIVQDGAIVDEWGEVEKEYLCHSMRKSFLSALYGIAVAAGKADLSRTMAELGIDDNPPALTETEKKATLGHLLKARSGIYHPALAETPGMKAVKPLRGSHAPGAWWSYNNWDFNALGTIYEKLTGEKIHASFDQHIGREIGMEHFTERDGAYTKGEDSIHPAYPFKMSARDLARFGLLFLNNGKWNGKQVVPEAWVAESTRSYSDASTYGGDGYGYMWWVDRHGYSARGAGGHYLYVIPAMRLVVAHRVDTSVAGNSVSGRDFHKLLDLIVAAGGRKELTPVAASRVPPPCHKPTAECAEKLYKDGQYVAFYRSHSLQNGVHPGVTRALVMVHGAARNGDAYYGVAMASAAAAGRLAETALVAPHFRANTGGCKDQVEPAEFAWTCEDWKIGNEAANAKEKAANSFDFIDGFVRLLNNPERFPNLKEIVVAGHSAGGQFIQRYAAMTAVESRLPLRYFVANPSSYMYLNEKRISRQGACDTEGNCKGRFGPYWDRSNCTTYNHYKHGLEELTGYAATVGAKRIETQFPTRNVTYLVGALDVNQDSDLESTCNAQAQGFNRRERGLIFWNYMRKEFQAEHKVSVVGGCGHSATCMYASPSVLPLLFP